MENGLRVCLGLRNGLSQWERISVSSCRCEDRWVIRFSSAAVMRQLINTCTIT